MIDTSPTRRQIMQRLQDGLRQEPANGSSFSEHINQVLDSAASELSPEGAPERAQADIDAFVQSLRPALDTDSSSYKRALAKTVLQAYAGDIHLSLARSFDFLLKSAVSYDPTFEALRPPPIVAGTALAPPDSYQDLLSLRDKASPKALLDKIFGNTFVIPS